MPRPSAPAPSRVGRSSTRMRPFMPSVRGDRSAPPTDSHSGSALLHDRLRTREPLSILVESPRARGPWSDPCIAEGSTLATSGCRR
jgi:hypothetical protein